MKNVIFEILWEEIEQKPYNMLYNHLFQLLEHILTLLMVREASFVAQILLKMTQISAICGIFEEFEHSISQIEVSITPFGQFWCIKWSLTIWFGFLFLRVKLQDWGTLPSSPIRWTVQGFPPFLLAGRCPRQLFSPLSKAKQCPFSIILAKIPSFCTFIKNSVKYRFF